MLNSKPGAGVAECRECRTTADCPEVADGCVANVCQADFVCALEPLTNGEGCLFGGVCNGGVGGTCNEDGVCGALHTRPFVSIDKKNCLQMKLVCWVLAGVRLTRDYSAPRIHLRP